MVWDLMVSAKVKVRVGVRVSAGVRVRAGVRVSETCGLGLVRYGLWVRGVNVFGLVG